MTRRSLEDIEAHADELADAFESYEPEPEDESAALPPLMAARLDAQAASAPVISFREHRPSATAMTRA